MPSWKQNVKHRISQELTAALLHFYKIFIGEKKSKTRGRIWIHIF